MKSRRSTPLALTCAALTTSTWAADAQPALQADLAALSQRAQLAPLALGDAVSLSVRLDTSTDLQLELTRFDPIAPGAQVLSVDAQGTAHPIDISGTVHLKGHVLGHPERLVYLSVSDSATNGFIEHGSDILVVSDANRTKELAITPSSVMNIEPLGLNCAVDMNNPEFNPLGLALRSDFEPADPATPQGTAPARHATIAVDADYEFSADLFGGNTTNAADYIATLFGAVSTIYERDINMTLSISYLRTYETNNDPYGGSDIYDFIDDVQNEFNSGDEADIERAAVHGISGRSLGGGLGYVGAACSDFWGIAVSADMNGFFPTPLGNSDGNWDLIVCAHELGHNFGSGHTHDSYSPPIDGCGSGDCSNTDGTIMSYCHLCPGGLSNMSLDFHPRVQDVILDYLDIAGCDLTVGTECDADLTNDGTIDFFDLSLLLSSELDYTGDTAFDFFDVSAWISDYSAGCP